MTPLRGAFQLLWDLNVKAVPSALSWAISFWFVMESQSLFIRALAIIVASLTALISVTLVSNEFGGVSAVAWTSLFKDRLTWKLLTSTGLLLDMSLQNADQAKSGSYFVKLGLSALFLSSLILWLMVLVVYLPVRAQIQDRAVPLATVAATLEFVRHRVKYVVSALSVLLLAWPIFFIYLFLGLTFAHSVIVSSLGDLANASTRKTRVQVA